MATVKKRELYPNSMRDRSESISPLNPRGPTPSMEVARMADYQSGYQMTDQNEQREIN